MIGTQDLEILRSLRIYDWETDRLRERALVIPRELERLEKELGVHQEMLDEEERKLQDLRMDRRAAEREVEMAKTRRREFEAQQYKIRNNQEYQANIREIENMKEKARQFDDKSLEILEQEEVIQKEIDRLRQIVDEEKRKHDAASERLRAELAEVQKELDGQEKLRDQAAEKLTPSLRAKYDRIRRSKGGLAIVGVEAGACGGCGYGLPPQRLQELRRNRDLVVCEGCGRILLAVEE
ncbi:MAG: zinc ribbon domain-containing protein [Candidatus Eisenbacteria bacterium]|nr:C4-type zinc ribbon domain-containing protein [Candidatus Eisenbacteria bacterium]